MLKKLAFGAAVAGGGALAFRRCRRMMRGCCRSA